MTVLVVYLLPNTVLNLGLGKRVFMFPRTYQIQATRGLRRDHVRGSAFACVVESLLTNAVSSRLISTECELKNSDMDTDPKLLCNFFPLSASFL